MSVATIGKCLKCDIRYCPLGNLICDECMREPFGKSMALTAKHGFTERMCECGQPGKHRKEHLPGFRCDACQVTFLNKLLEERSAQLRSILSITNDRKKEYAMQSWDEGTKESIQMITNTLGREQSERSAKEMHQKEAATFWKRIQSLEAERGPGLSAPKPLQTCDIGADWED